MPAALARLDMKKSGEPGRSVSPHTLMQGPLYINRHQQDIIADHRLQTVILDIPVTDKSTRLAGTVRNNPEAARWDLSFNRYAVREYLPQPHLGKTLLSWLSEKAVHKVTRRAPDGWNLSLLQKGPGVAPHGV